eukprot:TRINITY_DN3057_c0_g5_i1.p1 TRINITY_DN3057_c0_g5~~TRINITY_DN3057_c0_g5_i1.p1  ORF type:complete len:239 (+),score=45.90 TRINITY_DN3057_c0_g5_i1:73-789(+)
MPKGQAVVVLGGALNPVHQGHIQCLSDGKAEAEKLGYEVLWCTFAAANDGYVEGKMRGKGTHLDSNERLGMIRLLTEERGYEWFKMPAACYSSDVACGRDMRPHDNVKVVSVVGSDRAAAKWLYAAPPDVLQLCLPRGEEEGNKLKRQYTRDSKSNKVKNKSFHIASTTGPDTSSTLIRRLFTDLLTASDPAPSMAALASHGYTPDMVNCLLMNKRSTIKKMCGKHSTQKIVKTGSKS